MAEDGNAQQQDVQQEAQEPGSQGQGYLASFGALKDSVVQGNAIRKKARELQKYEEQTQTFRDTLADQERILADFDAIVAEQREQQASLQQRFEEKSSENIRMQAELERVQESLAGLRASNQAYLEQLQAELDARVDAAAAQHEAAKEQRKAVQAQLDGAKAALKEEGEEPSPQAQAKVGELAAQTDAAKASERDAKDSLSETKAQTKRAYRDEKQAREADEQPLKDAIDDAKAALGKLETELAANKDEQEKVQRRIGYCMQVKEHPEQADELRQRIAQRDLHASRLRAEVDDMGREHAQTKRSARKAKTAAIVAGVVVALLVVVVVALVLSGALG